MAREATVQWLLLTWLVWAGHSVLNAVAIRNSTPAGVMEARNIARLKFGDGQGIAELVEAPYDYETHVVQTTDGYLLSVFRIFNAQGRQEGVSRPAVLLQHGLLDSCAGFLLQGPKLALGYLLVDAGFDVWLGNSRGSTQSRQHAWLSTDSADYWSFSFDEMAKYDLPETVQYVRAVTNQSRIHFAAHSQGGTILLASLASRALPAQHLDTIALMAPVAMATHVTSIPLVAMSALGTDRLFTMLGVREFLPSVRMISWLEGQLCVLQPDMCISFLAAICGYSRNMVNTTRLPLYLTYTPAGTSVQNMAHWAQMVRGGASPGRPALAKFDWGTSCGARSRCNQFEYGSLDPPVYHLSDIDPQTRMFLFSGGVDALADVLDTELLIEALPPGVLLGHQADPDLEHLDYIWGMDAAARVYSRIVRVFKGSPHGSFDVRGQR